jgi:hypothetical protein
MRRSVLTSLGTLSITVLMGALVACATAPTDEGGAGLGTAANPSEPSGGAKLPPASNPPSSGGSSKDTADAGETTDAGSTQQDSGSPPPPPPDAGPSGPELCDMNDFTMAIKAADELDKASPRMCDPSGNGCKAGTECCFQIYMVCVDK